MDLVSQWVPANIATLLYNSTGNTWNMNIGVSAVGNVTAPYFIGNGSQLTGVTASGVAAAVLTGNTLSSNVLFSSLSSVGTLANLSVTGNATGGNILTAGIVSAVGNVTGNYFIGNGSQLTGLPAGYANANAVAYGESGWAGNIVPSGNAVYSLGNATNQWNDLYVSNATIFMNNVPISLSAGNVLTVNGEDVVVASNTGLVSVSSIDIGTTNFLVGDDDYLVFEGLVPGGIRPAETDTYNLGNVGKIWSEIHANVYYGNGSQLTGINVSTSSISNGNSNVAIPTANGNVTVTANTQSWLFETDGRLFLPNDGVINASGNSVDIGSDDAISLEANTVVNIYTDTNGTTYQWQFGDAGELTLPASSEITEVANPGGFPGYAMALAPDVNNAIDADQQLLIYPTGGADANHLHLTSGNLYNTELFLGNDNLYVKLANTGNVVVNSNDDTGNSAQWTFGTSGNLTLPMGGVVYETNIPDGALSGSAIALKPTGGTNADQQLLIYPTVNDANHLHLTSGNLYNTELFLGNDDLYVKLANTGNVVVNSNNDTGNTAQWNFDYNGVLTLPAGSSRITSYGQITIETDNNASGMYLNADGVNLLYANTNVTLRANSIGTNKDWNFGNTGVLTLPNADATGFGNIYFEQNSSTITFGLDDNATPYLYSFATSGITLPRGGATIRDTVGNAVAFGRDAAATGPQGNAAVAIGQQAGETSQGLNAVAVGYQAGLNTQGQNAVAIGPRAGNATQGDNSVAIGTQAGQSSQGQFAVAIGDNAGNNAQGTDAVAIGASAGLTTQGNGAVAIGPATATTSQGDNAVAIGDSAGEVSQGEIAVAIGYQAGQTIQGNAAVAVGAGAGAGTQGVQAVAIGTDAGATTQANRAVAIGYLAGSIAQGTAAVAIGYYAGELNQGNNSIIINATDTSLQQTTANTFTVAPVRNDVANVAEILFYNTTSKEITYGNVISVAGNITGGNLITAGSGGNITLTGGNITGAGNISATGNITGNYFIGNGSQLTGITASVPSQTILPTIQTITVEARPAGLFGGGQGGANVTVANTIPVTEYGVIITDGTTSEKYKTGSLGSIPGTVSLTFTTGLNSAQFTVFAYVTSNAGTYYSNSATGTSGICLLAGTQIALSDGTRKAIEHITYTDKMLSWDFDRGCYAETTALWIKRGETGSQYNLLTFSDGTTLRTFDQHRIFNKQAGAFTYPMTDATPVGTVTVNEHGQEITLTNKQVIVDTIEYYNVITDHHMNLFSDTVLTSCRFNNIYPITDMKFVKDGRTLRTRAEFENIPDRFFYGLRLAEQTTDIETVEWYVNRLLRTEVSTESELTV
jgi:hypothetical protein